MFHTKDTHANEFSFGGDLDEIMPRRNNSKFVLAVVMKSAPFNS
jgi:hypothetical protein